MKEYITAKNPLLPYVQINKFKLKFLLKPKVNAFPCYTKNL